MRQKRQLIPLHLAPPARISIAKLQKINRPVEFRPPARWLYASRAWVDLHERPRPQHRIQRVIVHSDKSVAVLPKLQMLQNREGNVAPVPHHPRKQIRSVEIDALVELYGHRHFSLGLVLFRSHKVGPSRCHFELPQSNVAQIYAVHGQQFRKSHVVNDTEGDQFVDAGYRVSILELRQPGVGNVELLISLRIGYALTLFFHFPSRDSRSYAKLS